MKLEVIIIAETNRCTVSHLRVDGQFFCFVLEDGFRDKKVYGQTRIPDGTYPVKKRTLGKFFEQYNRQYGHEFVPHICDVPEFEYILIHQGNSPVDTHGCLLVGDSLTRTPDGQFLITSGYSKPAYKRLYEHLKSAYRTGQEVTITLKRDTLNVATDPQPAIATV